MIGGHTIIRRSKDKCKRLCGIACVIFWNSYWNSRLAELSCFDLVWYFFDLILGEPQILISMISGVWDVSRPPHEANIIFGDARIPNKIKENPWNIFETCYPYKSQKLKNPKKWHFWKRKSPTNPEDPFHKILKVLKMIIWTKYSLKTLKTPAPLNIPTPSPAPLPLRPGRDPGPGPGQGP